MDNLPVDVAQSMGADLTLAVHLETAKLDPTATCPPSECWAVPSVWWLPPMNCAAWKRRTC